MGSNSSFNIDELISSNHLVNYVETGTGMGGCLAHALKFPFKRCVSVDVDEEFYNDAKLKYPSCELHLGESLGMLREVLPTLEGNTLFFLDAHFPGADFKGEEYGLCKDEDRRIPLQRELEIICKYRKGMADVLLIDDLRIYMDGPFQNGTWAERPTAGSSKSGFIFDILTELGKSIYVDYRDEGYVLGT
tara:strand:- start:12937 stop:13506 length:570 start_codon:yes stop_codon:yes gene_type:complete